jgi:hypothetical protein
MLGEGARIPVRVVLRGESDGWHAVIVDAGGRAERFPLGRGGTAWQLGAAPDSVPPWWRRRLAEVAQSLREQLETTLTDRCFADFGREARITWLGIDEPVCWEGLVALREADPARFPGRVAPFVITLEPGRGVQLPGSNLLFDTVAADAWTALETVALTFRSPPPTVRSLCGWADHRDVRIGRGLLAVSTERRTDGGERVAEIFGERAPGWGGNPDLRVRLDGIDLLHEPAEHVVALLAELGHTVVSRGRTKRLPALGLTLFERETPGHFGAFSLRPAGPQPS